jgi:hypothetical protein
MWRVYKAGGRPWPVICPEDDVLDYMVMEAVSIKAAMEDKKRQEEEKAEAERKEYKSDFSELERYR